MNKLSAWMKSWTVPQAIVIGFSLACATALAVSITMSDGWGKLVTWLSDGQHQALLLSLAAFFGALYHRALGLPPPASTTSSSSRSSTAGFIAISLLAQLAGAAAFALAAALLLHGCGGAQLSDSQHAALALETQRCLVNEREIVDRPATTRAQDEADMATERARCDAARAAIVNGEQKR